MSYSKKRYFVYFSLTLFIMLIPFITINNNHILLLSFDKLQFHFLGSIYSVSELYVMPFLLMFLFIGIFAMTSIFGRIWCGWSCPQTIFRVIYRDLIESTILDLRRIKNKQKEIDYNKKANQIKKYIAVSLWFVITLIISSNFMLYFIPPEDFFVYIQNPAEHSFMIIFILTIALFLVYDIVFMNNRGGKVYENNIKSIFKVKDWSKNEECTTCELCVKVCPTHIDIRKGLQVECINCLECSDACATVMGKLNKESLINWGSTNKVINKKNVSIFTKKNTTYFVSLFLCIFLAFYFSLEKENFLVNVNKTTELYSIKENDVISNNYILTIHNTQDKDYTFDIRLVDNKNFRIKRFDSFDLKAAEKTKKILILETTEDFKKLKNKPSNISIEIFTKENEKIKVKRQIAFFYPKN